MDAKKLTATTGCNGIAPTKCEDVYTFSVNETPCNSKHNNAGTVSARRFSSVLLLPIVVFVILFTTACKDDALIQAPFAVPQNSVGATIDPANPDNPYDNYGFHHNAAIDYYLANRTYFGSSFDSLKGDMNAVMSNYYMQTEMSGYYSTPGNALSSPLAIELCDSLFDNCLIRYGGVSIDSTIVNTIINTAKQWETDLATFISNNPGAIPADDIKTLFITSSILRYSAAYWYNDYNKLEGSIFKGDVFVDIEEVPVDEDGKPNDPPILKGWLGAIIGVACGIYVDAKAAQSGSSAVAQSAISCAAAAAIAVAVPI